MQVIEAIRETVHKRVVRLMGNRFEISIVSDDEQWAENLIESAILEIRRIENLLTTYTDRSQTNQVNAYAGIKPVRVNRGLLILLMALLIKDFGILIRR
jgi:FAD:protein FMN transferase